MGSEPLAESISIKRADNFSLSQREVKGIGHQTLPVTELFGKEESCSRPD